MSGNYSREINQEEFYSGVSGLIELLMHDWDFFNDRDTNRYYLDDTDSNLNCYVCFDESFLYEINIYLDYESLDNIESHKMAMDVFVFVFFDEKLLSKVHYQVHFLETRHGWTWCDCVELLKVSRDLSNGNCCCGGDCCLQQYDREPVDN